MSAGGPGIAPYAHRVGHAQVVVLGDQDRPGVVAAGRARRVPAHLEGPEALLERVVGQQPPTSGSPNPSSNLIVSTAWIEPTMPGRTPSTPASAQLGASSAGAARGSCSDSTVRRRD